jgi:hypothetical protein
MSWLTYKQSALANTVINQVPAKGAGDHIPLILVSRMMLMILQRGQQIEGLKTLCGSAIPSQGCLSSH